MDPEKRKQLLAQGFTEAEVNAMESALLLKVEEDKVAVWLDSLNDKSISEIKREATQKAAVLRARAAFMDRSDARIHNRIATNLRFVVQGSGAVQF
jgi:ribosomal protein L12E/L44/L45/RPP1/RPP2